LIGSHIRAYRLQKAIGTTATREIGFGKLQWCGGVFMHQEPHKLQKFAIRNLSQTQVHQLVKGNWMALVISFQEKKQVVIGN